VIKIVEEESKMRSQLEGKWKKTTKCGLMAYHELGGRLEN
jgi:hypothetical protein